MLFGSLAVFVLLLETACAFPAHTTAGTHFVVAFPPIGNELSQDEVVKIRLTTREKFVKVNISLPLTIFYCTSERFLDKSVSLRRFVNVPFELKTKFVMRETGLYNAISIRSSSAIRTYVDLKEHNLQRSDFVTLLPLESCMYSYYVTTLPGHPYFLVISFNKKTNLNAKFPKFSQSFSVACKADKPCEPNATVQVQLNKYSAWFLFLNGSEYDLHNTYIEADSPVFVMSGNRDCHIGNDNNSMDTCATAPAPSTAWGRKYVVPAFEDTSTERPETIFRFNAGSFPFAVTLVDGTRSQLKQLARFDALVKANFSNPVVVSAEETFGLCLFYSVDGEGLESEHNSPCACLTNVIPVEQWMSSFLHVAGLEEVATGSSKAFVMTNTGQQLLYLPDYKNKVRWMQLNQDNVTYTFATLKISQNKFKLFSRVQNSKLMVYILDETPKTSCSLRALDYYQGEIYSPKCTKSLPVKSDGLDNDCDGSIDEEFNNGVDDDEDGLVDEDTVPVYALLGKWTGWTVCLDTCGNRTVARKVRTCTVRTFPYCDGLWEMCDPGPTCPNDCEWEKTHQACSCAPGCPNCDSETGECHCPLGFPNCAVSDGGILDDIEYLQRGDSTGESSLNKLYLVIPVAAVVILGIVLFLIILRSRLNDAKAERSDEEGDEDENEDEQTFTENMTSQSSQVPSDDTYASIHVGDSDESSQEEEESRV